MSTYSKHYSQVLRYGRAPAAEIATFANLSAETGNQDPHSNSDAAFADFLEDHDDPRHLIVRRDLALRQIDYTDWSKQLHRDAKSRFEHKGPLDTGFWVPIERPSSDTLREASVAASPDGGQMAASAVRSATDNSVVGMRVSWHPANGEANYLANLHPHEFDSMMEALGHQHRAADFAKVL